MEIENQYPIGKFEAIEFSTEAKETALSDIKNLPSALENALHNLDEVQLQTPYREGGWTVQQLVHHIADSHMNAYIRFKLALTENIPAIKPYDEKAWTTLDDIKAVSVNVSVTLLHALHQRWYEAIKNLSDNEWQRKLFHPERQKELSLWFFLQLYSWHSKHHVAQIINLKKKMNW
jgi:hypothetical protein